MGIGPFDFTPPRGQSFNIPQAPQPAPGGGMFAGGGKFGIGQAIVAALNGYLAGTRGPGQEAAMQNLQMMAAMRQRALEHQQSLDDYNRHRADENTDWKTHFDYTQANSPDAFETAAQAGGYKPGTPEWAALMKSRADNLADPIVMTPYGPMKSSQAMQMGGGQPAAPGVTFTPIPPGGQTPPASGNFPR